RPLPRAPTTQPHCQLLVLRLLLRWALLLEPGKPGLCGAVPGGHIGVVRGLLLVHLHQGAQLGVLVVPATTQLVQAGEPLPPGLVVRLEAARVGPGGAARPAELE